VIADTTLITTLVFSRNVIKEKWTNTRDAFMRSLRKKSGQAATKKYLYADFLQFLLKVTEKDETESSICEEVRNESTETQEEEETETVVQKMGEASTSSRDAGTLQHRKRKTTKVSDEIDRKILKSLEKIEPDEDEAFFISVLPSVRQFSADDKLDFRMIVLKAIKDIKTRSRYVSSPFSTQTPSPNSSHGTGILSHYPYELASNSGKILTSPHTTASPTPMQTFLNLQGQAEYHAFQQ
jgi:hypothetical protein